MHYTYFLTPTRLYVMEDRVKLAALLDAFDQGRLIATPAGFGLLTSKTLQWFTPDGTKTSELTARDPIRIHLTNSARARGRLRYRNGLPWGARKAAGVCHGQLSAAYHVR